jgi:hypothetical protein
MPTAVIRRTQVTVDKIPDENLTGAKLVSHTIGSAQIGSILPTAAVANRALGSEVLGRRKLTYFEDVGSKAPPSGGSAYITFSRAFAAAPYPSLTKKDAYSEATYQTRVTRVTVGSMFMYGSPSGYVYYRAIGSA